MVDLYAPERLSVRAALSRPFRVLKRRRKAFGALLAFDSLIAALLVAAHAAAAVRFVGLDGGTVSLDAQTAAMAMAILLLLMLGVIVWSVMSDAAWHRLLTDRKPHLPPPYRFRADEGRIFLVYLTMFGLIYGAMFVAVIALILPAALVLGDLTADGPAGAANAMALSPFVMNILVFFITIRFAVAAPLSVASRRLRLLDGWRATRGVAWRLIAAHLIIAGFALLMAAPFVILVLNAQETPAAAHGPVIDAGLPALLGAIGFQLAAAFAYCLFFRGVSAEAAMVHLTRERKAPAGSQGAAATPPASPDAPGRAPEGV